MGSTRTPNRRLSGWRVAGIVVLGLVAVVALSWLVGWLAEGEPFNWEVASVFGTAAGTTLLAVATGALAYLTWGDVTATQELAQLGRVDQEERERPILVVMDVGWMEGSQFAGDLVFRVTNAGLGPALNVVLTAEYVGDKPVSDLLAPEVFPVIAPGDNEAPVRFTVVFAGPTAHGANANHFRIGGYCFDRRDRRHDVKVAWPLKDDAETPALR